MADSPEISADATNALQRISRHEILLGLLGLYTWVALLVRAGPLHTMTIVTGVMTCAYATLVCVAKNRPSPGWQKGRDLAGYLYVLWYYLAVASLVRAIGLPAQDDKLMSTERWLFGETPSVAFQQIAFRPLTEVMSGCYLTYLFYLHLSLLTAMCGSAMQMRRWANWILSVFAIGLPGYLCLPARGPGAAFPELYAEPLVGGLLTKLNDAVVSGGSAVYDVFPSLHVLVTLALLTYDRIYVPTRFRRMWIWSIGIFLSAIYLRYHYAVDLLAAAAWYSVALVIFRPRRDADVATGD